MVDEEDLAGAIEADDFAADGVDRSGGGWGGGGRGGLGAGAGGSDEEKEGEGDAETEGNGEVHQEIFLTTDCAD